MGKGDIKTKRGKIVRGTYGVRRLKKKKKTAFPETKAIIKEPEKAVVKATKPKEVKEPAAPKVTKKAETKKAASVKTQAKATTKPKATKAKAETKKSD